MLKLGIGGNFYSVLKSMYQNSKVRVITDEGLSDAIAARKGVRQGDSISPFLFNTYVNDLPELFLEEECKAPKLLNETVPALLYADDLVILSTTSSGIQHSLNKLHSYCDQWKLEVNMKKSNIMIMGSRTRTTDVFGYGDKTIDIVDQYRYLGIIINKQGSFKQAKNDLKRKALKAIFGMWACICPYKVPNIKLANKMSDTLIKPIVLYNQNIWISEITMNIQKYILSGNNPPNLDYLFKTVNNEPCEQVHLKYCKMMFGVGKNTANAATRAELGRYPLYIESYIAMVKYWLRLYKLPNTRLIVDALKCDENIHETGIYTWTSMVKYLLTKYGFSEVWENKQVTNEHDFFTCFSDKLKLEYQTMSKTLINRDRNPLTGENNKLRTYKLTKTEFKEEKYLSLVTKQQQRCAVTKLHLSSHDLMIEKGRKHKIDSDKRFCNKCEKNEVEDEYHAIMN